MPAAGGCSGGCSAGGAAAGGCSGAGAAGGCSGGTPSAGAAGTSSGAGAAGDLGMCWQCGYFCAPAAPWRHLGKPHELGLNAAVHWKRAELVDPNRQLTDLRCKVAQKRI